MHIDAGLPWTCITAYLSLLYHLAGLVSKIYLLNHSNSEIEYRESSLKLEILSSLIFCDENSLYSVTLYACWFFE